MRGLIGIWRGWPLWRRVLVGLAGGIALGIFWPNATPWFAFAGDLFVRLIRMLVVPVVFVSIAAGVAALADPRKLGAVGGRTLLIFAFTTACAVAIGMTLGLVLEPGAGADIGSAQPHILGEPKPLYDQFISIVPVNIVEVLLQGDMLAIIFFAMAFGFSVVLAGEEGEPVARFLQSTANVLFRLVGLIMELTPYGVFALIANAVAQNGVAVFANVGWLALCVVLGVLAQIVLIHVPMLVLLAKRSVGRFFRAALDALVVAFSTASLFMLAAVLASVGISPAQTALVIGFVLPFDRLLDMTRTVASASANLTVTASVARLQREDPSDAPGP
ncbi:dicarboxylate/amino acid:cation symporter [Qipengyuania sp.]|uniref:dicarboxylate/amino acid:cation symporter n=1 Tax=Qipengyuania sp. TaxID=2004515 RepID=UPI0035C84D00